MHKNKNKTLIDRICLVYNRLNHNDFLKSSSDFWDSATPSRYGRMFFWKAKRSLPSKR